MTKDEIIKMTYLVGAKRLQEQNQDTEFLMSQDQLERFAALVAEKDREACAKVCEEMPTYVSRYNALIQASAKNCAAAIRARGNK